MVPRIVPFGLWMRTWVSSDGCVRKVVVDVGVLSRLGLIGYVEKVVCIGCHPPFVGDGWGVQFWVFYWRLVVDVCICLGHEVRWESP